MSQNFEERPALMVAYFECGSAIWIPFDHEIPDQCMGIECEAEPIEVFAIGRVRQTDD